MTLLMMSSSLGLVLTGLLLHWLGAIPTLLIEWLILLLGAVGIIRQRQFWQV